jgi:hypothetical protein
MKTTENYQNYQLYSDKELVNAILKGNIDAVYYIVRIKYQKKMYAVIAKQLIKVLNEYTEIDLEYWLYKFYNYMIIPTKIKKESKFKNMKNKDNIQHWLCQCCRFFLINDAEFRNLPIHNFDFNRLHTLKSETYSRSMREKFIRTIETFNKILTNREKYVVFTYLYCEKKQTDVLLHLDKKLSIILNTSEGNIRKIKSVAYDKVRKVLYN